MRFAVLFTDPPSMNAVREQHGQAHLQFLQAHADEILIAGGLRDEPGGAFTGGLWVVEAASMERVQALLALDPYFQYGERQYQIKVWGKAFADKQVLL
ncbi:hypothetical protein KIK84_03490 [Curvibacter sp. CHRR-16]|uniref:YciI family protein n=1 Tax=Curvibacter sp. CHRR-16 TaxID=2835872 RepID=UPI001BD91BF7|nr:YciI family protein [Curvibacter sp. CHRR-16]MBT0569375.1 hypothetical protein [Curvibacter sp. CHRR-16]